MNHNGHAETRIQIDRRKIYQFASLTLTVGSVVLAMAIMKVCGDDRSYHFYSLFLALGVSLFMAWCLIGSKERASIARSLVGGIPESYIEDKSHYLHAIKLYTNEVLSKECVELARREALIQQAQQIRVNRQQLPLFTQGLGFAALGALFMFGAMSLVMGGVIVDLSLLAMFNPVNAQVALSNLENSRLGLDIMQIGLYLCGMIGSGLGIVTGAVGFWQNRVVGTNPLDAPVASIQDKIDLINEVLRARCEQV